MLKEYNKNRIEQINKIPTWEKIDRNIKSNAIKTVITWDCSCYFSVYCVHFYAFSISQSNVINLKNHVFFIIFLLLPYLVINLSYFKSYFQWKRSEFVSFSVIYWVLHVSRLLQNRGIKISDFYVPFSFNDYRYSAILFVKKGAIRWIRVSPYGKKYSERYTM